MRIGELLVAAGLVSEHDIARAIDQQYEEDGRPGPNLVAMGPITEAELALFCDGLPV